MQGAARRSHSTGRTPHRPSSPTGCRKDASRLLSGQPGSTTAGGRQYSSHSRWQAQWSPGGAVLPTSPAGPQPSSRSLKLLKTTAQEPVPPYSGRHYWQETCFRKRSEEHTSELQSLMRTSYAVFCLKKKKYI